MRVISFSLFGDKPKYTNGAFINALLAPQVYPGWVCRFYHDNTVPERILSDLRQLQCETVDMTGHFASGMFWRFLVHDDPKASRWIVRDADSRLNYRERRAVDEWVESGKPFHIMRDHPLHGLAIMGCAFGGTPGFIQMESLMRGWTVFGHYGDDEKFLGQRVYSLIAPHVLVHSDYPHGDRPRPFPTPYEDWGYVGEPWVDPFTRNEAYRRMLIEYGRQSGMKNVEKEDVPVPAPEGR